MLESFQYISCYCLSNTATHTGINTAISIHLMLLFIYTRFSCSGDILYFNTSHVTVYLCIRTSNTVSIKYFNTSHVTVYRRRTYNYRKVIQISIHLILLFIEIRRRLLGSLLAFQYISCYCLSTLEDDISSLLSLFQYISCYCLSSGINKFTCNFMISIHLMLLFIVIILRWLRSLRQISIHLMLLFIGMTFYKVEEYVIFQYISCYCLSEEHP